MRTPRSASSMVVVMSPASMPALAARTRQGRGRAAEPGACPMGEGRGLEVIREHAAVALVVALEPLGGDAMRSPGVALGRHGVGRVPQERVAKPVLARALVTGFCALHQDLPAGEAGEYRPRVELRAEHFLDA